MPAYMTFVNDLTSLCVGERPKTRLALNAPSSPAPRQLERPPLPSAKIHETRAAMWRKEREAAQCMTAVDMLRHAVQERHGWLVDRGALQAEAAVLQEPMEPLQLAWDQQAVAAPTGWDEPIISFTARERAGARAQYRMMMVLEDAELAAAQVRAAAGAPEAPRLQARAALPSKRRETSSPEKPNHLKSQTGQAAAARAAARLERKSSTLERQEAMAAARAKDDAARQQREAVWAAEDAEEAARAAAEAAEAEAAQRAASEAARRAEHEAEAHFYEQQRIAQATVAEEKARQRADERAAAQAAAAAAAAAQATPAAAV